MVAFADRQPTRLLADQYRALFEHLCERFGREAWVERSGLTVRVMPELRAAFPDALYLHLHRDGPETALSMREHPWFRIAVYLGIHPPSVEEVLRLLEHASKDDLVGRLYQQAPGPELYGRHWTDVMARAYREFAFLPGGQYYELAYEYVLAHTRTTLTMAGEFLQIPDDEGWLDRAAALVGSDLRPRAPGLPEAERTALAAACLPGQILTGRAEPARPDNVQPVVQQALYEEIGLRPRSHG